MQVWPDSIMNQVSLKENTANETYLGMFRERGGMQMHLKKIYLGNFGEVWSYSFQVSASISIWLQI